MPPVEAQEPRDAAFSAEAILDRAFEQLAKGLVAEPAQHGLAGAEAIDRLHSVVDATRRIVRGEADPGDLSPSEHPALDARIVAVLRGTVLRIDAREVGADGVVQVVRALETALARVLGADDESSLAARLSQPDALQLLIEVAHDLRSPLTSILFLSETLRTGHSGTVNDQQRSQLGLIYSAALGLASLASNVIDLAREGKGLIDGDPELYSFAEMVRGVQEMVQPMADEKGVELRLSVPEYDRAHGHPLAVARVLLNLTTNALKFTDEGHVEIGVRRHSGSRIEFYVQDTGRGISEERKDELFDPFKKRLYSTGHFFSGSGVGLSMARRFVRAMGSDLAVASGPESGTRFSFVLDVPTTR